MSTGPDEDEEEKDLASVSRKAWFAGHQSAEPSFESAGFRGVPGVPHGGSQTVRPEHTGGSMEYCWCGQPFDHDWPGKSDGRKHPKESQVTPTAAATAPTEEQPRIERRALRAYNADLADIILTAVNEYGTKYRITAHSVILFPLDKTKPYAINARNGDRQVKGARVWFARHCIPEDISVRDAKPAVSTKPVDEEAVKELAEMLNSEEAQARLEQNSHRFDPPAETPQQPAEPHSVHTDVKPAPTPAMVATKKVTQAATPEPVAEESAAEPPDEWVPYIVNKGKGKERTHEFYLFNTVTGQIKCSLDEMILAGTKSTGGHTRTHHSDTTTLWGPQAKAKANTTYFTNKAKGQVEEAIGILQTAMGIVPPTADTSALEDELAKVTASRDDWKAKAEDWQTKYNELKAKFDLAKEAFSL